VKLSNYRSDYYYFSGAASGVARQSSFAGIALIWVFNTQTDTAIILPSELLWPTFFLIASLSCDLLHYISSTAIWGLFHRHKEKCGISENSEVNAPTYFNWPALAFFWGKNIFVLLGYCGLLIYVSKAIIFVST
jgi:hypothetical protein